MMPGLQQNREAWDRMWRHAAESATLAVKKTKGENHLFGN